MQLYAHAKIADESYAYKYGKKQLITRIRSEDDNRKIYVTLNDSMIKIYKKQHEKILKIVDELFEKIGYERQPEVIELFDLITQTAKEML